MGRFRKRTLRVRVEPIQGGGWILIDNETTREGPFPRKRDATLAGREYLKRRGGGDLLITNLSGRFTEHDEVPAP